MKFFIIFSAVAAVTLAKPSQFLLEPAHNLAHLSYATPSVHVRLVPGAPIGHDGRVIDTPEVAHAKAEHNTAHLNEKITLAHEAVKSADVVAYAAAPSVLTSYQSRGYASLPVSASYGHHGVLPVHHEVLPVHHGVLPVHHAVASVAYSNLVPAAPTGIDGRVVDTHEVAYAKAEHAAAHVNEKLTLAHEEAKSSHYDVPNVQLVSAYSSGSYAPYYQKSVAPLVNVW